MARLQGARQDLHKGETGYYSLEEIENIITALVDCVECQLIMALAYFFGLRRGEIQGLQWGDVDADWLHIRRNKVNGRVITLKGKKKSKDFPLIQPVERSADVVACQVPKMMGVGCLKRTFRTQHGCGSSPYLRRTNLSGKAFTQADAGWAQS